MGLLWCNPVVRAAIKSLLHLPFKIHTENRLSQIQIQQLMRPHLVTPETYATAVSPDEMAAKAGVPPDMIIRVNQNENPFGADPDIAASLTDLPLHLYPDANQVKIRASLSGYTGHPIEQILAGAGADEMIDLLMRLFVAPGDRVLDCKPTFGMYHFCARVADAKVVSIQRDEAFEVDVAAVACEDDERTKIVFLASPNNPTGNILTEEQTLELLKLGMVVVVDETYFEFSDQTVSHLIPDHENLVVLRSFSKWAGIAGLRVGYMIASPEIISRLSDIKNPYNVNIAAEAALLATMQHREKLLGKVAVLLEQRKRMEKVFDAMSGVSYVPSHGNFLLTRFDKYLATDLYEILVKKGVFVRPFSDPRLTHDLRISVGTPDETTRVLEVLSELV